MPGTEGHGYFRRKLVAGKSRNEALPLPQTPTLGRRLPMHGGRCSHLRYRGRSTQRLRPTTGPCEEVTGPDKTIDVVVNIFNRVNSGGTKLSKGDLALAKICAEWSAGRERMRAILGRWRDEQYHFDMDWAPPQHERGRDR